MLLDLAPGVAKNIEIVATFVLPEKAGRFGVAIGNRGSMRAPAGMAVGRMLPGNVTMPGYGAYNITHAATNTPAVCQAHCDGDDGCIAWSYTPAAPPNTPVPQCMNNRIRTDRICPQLDALPGAVTGYRNVSQLPGCIVNTSHLLCSIDYAPPQSPPPLSSSWPRSATATNSSSAPPPPPPPQYYNVSVQCGGTTDTLRLLTTEKTVELRLYSDWGMVEAFFQKGRVAMTVMSTMPQYQGNGLDDSADVALTSTTDITMATLDVYQMKGIWSTPEQIRAAPRVYPWNKPPAQPAQ